MQLKKQASTIFKILFAAGLVFWLIKTDRFNLEELKPFLKPFNFISGFSLVGLSLLLASERWRLLMKSHNLFPSLWHAWKLALTGVFFNFAVPGGVGGDVVKAYYLQKDLNTSRAAAFSSALMDRLVGLYALVFMAFAALVYEKYFVVVTEPHQMLETLFTWVALLFAALNAGTAFLIFFKWPDFIKNSSGLLGKAYHFAQACRFYFKKPTHILLAITLTLLAQFITVFFFKWAFHTVLHENVSWSLLFFVVPVGFMVMAIPITPAGVGVGQAAFYFLFQSFSNNEILTGSSVVTAFQLMLFAWGLIGAYYYLTRKTKIPDLETL